MKKAIAYICRNTQASVKAIRPVPLIGFPHLRG